MQQKIMNWACIFVVFATIIAMYHMVSYGKERELIYITGDSLVEDSSFDYGNASYVEAEFAVQKIQSGDANVIISCTKGIQESKVHITNDYINQLIILEISDTDLFVNELSPILDSGNYVQNASLYCSEEKVYVILYMSGLYEYSVTYKTNMIYFDFYSPKDLYEKIVVIDPACGGDEIGLSSGKIQEKDITLDVSLIVQTKLEELGYKVYYTRTSDRTVSDEMRLRLINESMADMTIRISIGSSTDLEEHGVKALYNSYYFIPNFSSIELADKILKNVVLQTETNALGLEQALEEDTVVMGATVPVTEIQIGMMSNELEREWLQKNGYLEVVAQGIVAGIIESFQYLNGE